MGHVLFLEVSALENTNCQVAGHAKGGPHGKELMSSPIARGPKATVSHKVSLGTGHQRQALRRLQLWLVSWLQPRDQKQCQGQKQSHRQPSGCTQFPAHRNDITIKMGISSAYDWFVLYLLHLFVCVMYMYMCMHVCMFVGIHVCECVCLYRPEVDVTSLQSALLLAFMWVLGM